MNNKKWILIAKYATYAIGMVLLFVVQTTPGFLTVFGVKPNFVIPAAVCIAMYEGEFIGGIYGAFAGMLCDLGGFSLFGFNAIILLISGVAVGLLVIYMLRVGMINFVLLLSCVLLLRGLLDYLLSYVMWDYDNVWMLFIYTILPGIIYTVAASPLVYFLYRYICNYFDGWLKS